MGLVAGVRNCSWQHRKNNNLWCLSSFVWEIGRAPAAVAVVNACGKRPPIPRTRPDGPGSPFTPQITAATFEANGRRTSPSIGQVNGRARPFPDGPASPMETFAMDWSAMFRFAPTLGVKPDAAIR